MKKLNLLLATTAILSMGAMTANAKTDDILDVDVKAEIIHARNLSATPLDFGQIVINTSVEELGVDWNSSGEEIITDGSSSARIFKTGSKAVITGANCSQLESLVSYSAAQLTPPTGKTIETAHITDFACSDDANGKATIKARLYLYNDGATIPEGKYTGKFTVTAIYPENSD